jgi:hypothetical protein
MNFLNENEIESEHIRYWAPRLNNPNQTQLRKELKKRVSRYNQWRQELPITQNSETNNHMILTYEKDSNSLTNYQAIQYGTITCNIDKTTALSIIQSIQFRIQFTNGTITLFSMTLAHYLAILQVLNIETTTNFMIPFQYMIFHDQLFWIVKPSFEKIMIDIEFNTTEINYEYHLSALCYKINLRELVEMNEITIQYYITKILTIQLDTLTESTYNLDLNYGLPINSIVAYNYNINGTISILLDNHIPFIGSYIDIPFKNTFHYLQEIDSTLVENLQTSEEYMYYRAIPKEMNFYSEYDIYCKFIPNHKNVRIQTNSSTEPIGSIILSIQFDTILTQSNEQCYYAICYKAIDVPQQINTLSYPLVKIDDTHYFEGYWQTILECGCCNPIIYPYPIETNIPIDLDYLNQLNWIINNTDQTDSNSYTLAEDVLCKFENTRLSGNIYIIFYQNIYYQFQHALLHYYEVHHVQPSNEFYQAVMNVNAAAAT